MPTWMLAHTAAKLKIRNDLRARFSVGQAHHFPAYLNIDTHLNNEAMMLRETLLTAHTIAYKMHGILTNLFQKNTEEYQCHSQVLPQAGEDSNVLTLFHWHESELNVTIYPNRWEPTFWALLTTTITSFTTLLPTHCSSSTM